MAYADSTTNSAEPAIDAVAAIEAVLTAHAGWVFIEQYDFTQSGTAKRARVWKCLGAQNNGGQDFHLAITRWTAAGSTTMGFRVFEGYNPTAHTVIRPVTQNGTGFSTTDRSIGNGNEYAFTLVAGAGYQSENSHSFPASVPVDHFIVVSKSFLCYSMNRTGAASATYIGNYVPRHSTTFNPVFMAGAGFLSLSNGGPTRFPGLTILPGTNCDASIAYATPPSGFVGSTSLYPDAGTALMEAAPVAVLGSTATTAPSNVAGNVVRGTIPTSVMVIPQEGNPRPRNGDYVTIGSDLYFRCGNISNAMNIPNGPSQGWYMNRAADW